MKAFFKLFVLFIPAIVDSIAKAIERRRKRKDDIKREEQLARMDKMRADLKERVAKSKALKGG